uniref:Uncharacterized protein n=1 Tax=Tetraselmis chuii TaxID=63592 RepID=A0A7S1X697_9CHLO
MAARGFPETESRRTENFAELDVERAVLVEAQAQQAQADAAAAAATATATANCAMAWFLNQQQDTTTAAQEHHQRRQRARDKGIFSPLVMGSRVEDEISPPVLPIRRPIPSRRDTTSARGLRRRLVGFPVEEGYAAYGPEPLLHRSSTRGFLPSENSTEDVAWLSLPLSMKCQLLDLAAELDSPLLDVLDESIKLLTASLRSRSSGGMWHHHSSRRADAEMGVCGLPAEHHPKRSVWEASTEVFNAAQKLAYSFPDVGVSLVVTPPDRRQLVFSTDGMACGDHTEPDEQRLQRSSHPATNGEAVNDPRRRRADEAELWQSRRLHSRRVDNRQEYPIDPARIGGSLQDQNDCRSSLKDTATILRRENILADKRRGEYADAGTEARDVDCRDDREHVVVGRRHGFKRKNRGEGASGPMSGEYCQKSNGRKVAQGSGEVRPSADSMETCSEASDDGESSRKQNEPKKQIFRQRWTQAQMQELRRVVLSYPVSYGHWDEVFEKSEILRASHFTAEAARKKAMRMGLLR